MEAKKAMKIPKFKNADEEAQWWYDNREELGEEFAQAMREGRTTRLTTEKLLERIETAKAQAINIRIPENDLALARKLAESKGLPYQTYIKSLLHEALQREARRK